MPRKPNKTHTALLVELGEEFDEASQQRIKRAIQTACESEMALKRIGAWTWHGIQEMKFDPEWGSVVIYQP